MNSATYIPSVTSSTTGHKHAHHSWTAVTGAVLEMRNGQLARRARRVILLTAFLWVLNLFDLVLTIIAHRLGGFNELNPIARQLLDCPASLSVFKIALVMLSTVIILAYRHVRLTEIGCWGLCGIYSGLGFVWLVYFKSLMN